MRSAPAQHRGEVAAHGLLVPLVGLDGALDERGEHRLGRASPSLVAQDLPWPMSFDPAGDTLVLAAK